MSQKWNYTNHCSYVWNLDRVPFEATVCYLSISFFWRISYFRCKTVQTLPLQYKLGNILNKFNLNNSFLRYYIWTYDNIFVTPLKVKKRLKKKGKGKGKKKKKKSGPSSSHWGKEGSHTSLKPLVFWESVVSHINL